METWEKGTYEKPTYEKPTYEKPTYEKGADEKPADQTGAHEKPTYEKPIVVAFDGSDGARVALAWALDEGVRRGLAVRIAHVPDRDCRLYGQRGLGVGDLRHEAETTMKRIAAEADDWGSLGVEVSAVVLDGPTAQVLCELSRTAGLLVVGARGLGGFAGQRIGSVSQTVAAHAKCPVVVVRGSMHVLSSRPVVVGVDDCPIGSLAVDFAFQEAAARGVGLVAVRAWVPPRHLLGLTDPWAVAAFDAQRVAEQRILADAVAGGQTRYATVTADSQLVPVTATHALTVASRDAQLIVVGERGSGGFAGLALGSVGEQLLRHSLCALALVRGSPCQPG